MTSETEMLLQRQLSIIINRLDEIECKIDKVIMSEKLKQDDCTLSTESNQISQVVRARLSKALVQKRARAVAEMNEKL